MTYARYTLTVPAKRDASVPLTEEGGVVDPSFNGSIEGTVSLFVDVESPEQLAEHVFQLTTDRRGLVDELVQERVDTETDVALFSSDAKVALMSGLTPGVVYLAARRATNETRARSVVDQLLQWTDDDGPLDDIQDAPYYAEKAIIALVDDMPEPTTEIDADAQLSNVPLDARAK